MDFSKKILLIVAIWCMILVSLSYVLAIFGKNVNETVTVAIVTTLLSAIIGYFVKSFKEKDSRNKHHVTDNNTLINN